MSVLPCDVLDAEIQTMLGPQSCEPVSRLLRHHVSENELCGVTVGKILDIPGRYVRRLECPRLLGDVQQIGHEPLLVLELHRHNGEVTADGMGSSEHGRDHPRPPVVHQRPPWKEPVAVLPAIGGVAVAVAIVATGRRRTE